LSAALVLEDIDMFTTWKQRFESEVALIGEQDPYWKAYYIYDEVMHAVLTRDRERLLTMLADAERRFAARSSDRLAKHLPMAEAPPPLNELLIDFRATALGHLGLQRGMRIEFDSPAIPLRTVASWFP
jgi:hypothetical protein